MKKKRLVAFDEITLSKLLAMIFVIAYLATLIISIIRTLSGLDALPQLSELGQHISIILLGYFGKSGYEYYNRNKYGSYNPGYDEFGGMGDEGD